MGRARGRERDGAVGAGLMASGGWGLRPQTPFVRHNSYRPSSSERALAVCPRRQSKLGSREFPVRVIARFPNSGDQMSELDNLLINQEKIFDRLRGVSSALSRYASTISLLHTVNVSQDQNYQKTFCGFYRVRRGKDWTDKYFALLEQKKSELEPKFECILEELVRLTGRLEASFASKLAATIDPNLPVYDSIVRKNLCLPARYGDQNVRLKMAVQDYDAIKQSSIRQVKLSDFRTLRENFNRKFPEHQAFSDTKVLDLMLWQNR